MAKVGEILANAEQTGLLDETSLADLYNELADKIRAAWAGRENKDG